MKNDNSIPYGSIENAADIGQYIRRQRKARFISELENGKATMELGKVLKVLKCSGLQIKLQPRSWNQTD